MRQLQNRLSIGNSRRYILLEVISGGADAYEDELLVPSPSKRRKGCDAGARPVRPSVRPCDAAASRDAGVPGGAMAASPTERATEADGRATGLFHGHGRGRVARPEPSSHLNFVQASSVHVQSDPSP